MNVGTLQVRVAARQAETADVATFELVATEGGTLPPFTPGAHIDVHLGDGLVRQYSLCNAAVERDRYVIAVLRDAASRGGSVAMHERIQAGDTLRIGVPRNHFALEAAATRSLLIAGGIGVTPILCMAAQLDAAGADFEMHYCGRSLHRMAFREEIAASAFASRVHLYADDGPAAGQLDLEALLARPEPGLHLYVCGPQGLIAAVLATAKAAGWAAGNLHREFFSAGAPVVGADAGTGGGIGADRAFEIELRRSGRIVLVPADRTALQALAAAGVDIPSSCEQGVCGSCVTPLVAGVADHRDSFLTPQEQEGNTFFTPCCSRARSDRLVLDL